MSSSSIFSLILPTLSSDGCTLRFLLKEKSQNMLSVASEKLIPQSRISPLLEQQITLRKHTVFTFSMTWFSKWLFYLNNITRPASLTSTVWMIFRSTGLWLLSSAIELFHQHNKRDCEIQPHDQITTNSDCWLRQICFMLSIKSRSVEPGCPNCGLFSRPTFHKLKQRHGNETQEFWPGWDDQIWEYHLRPIQITKEENDSELPFLKTKGNKKKRIRSNIGSFFFFLWGGRLRRLSFSDQVRRDLPSKQWICKFTRFLSVGVIFVL
jgi:hypothetical protein